MEKDIFKKWFNSQFSLSYKGKFVGLDSLASREHFEMKFKRIVMNRDRRKKPLSDIIEFKTIGGKVKLYPR